MASLQNISAYFIDTNGVEQYLGTVNSMFSRTDNMDSGWIITSRVGEELKIVFREHEHVLKRMTLKQAME